VDAKIGVNHNAHSLLCSSLLSDLMNDLVDLIEGPRLAFWRLGHNVCHRRRSDALEIQGVPFNPDDETICWLEASSNLGRQFEGL